MPIIDGSEILAELPGGSIVGSVVKWVSGLVKGKTKHPDYEKLLAPANNWANTVVEAFSDFSKAELLLIEQKLYSRFISAQQTYWGLGSNMSAQIAKMYQAPPFQPLHTMAWLFFEWIGTNIDVEQPETFETFMQTLYPAVFLGAVTDAGLDVKRVKGVPGSAPANPTSGQRSEQTNQALLIGAGVLVALFLIMKTRKA